MNTTAENWQEPTDEQVAAWKKQHGVDEIQVLRVHDKRDNTVKKAYCRPPHINDLIRASQSNKEKAGTYNQSLYENLVLYAHPDIKAVQALYQGVVFAMDKVVNAADVEVEKL